MKVLLGVLFVSTFVIACSPVLSKPQNIGEEIHNQTALESTSTIKHSRIAENTEPTGFGGAPPTPSAEEIYRRGYDEGVFEDVGLIPYPNVFVDSGMRAGKNSRSTDLWHLSAIFGTEDSVKIVTDFYVKQLSDGKAIPITSNGIVRIEGVTKNQVVLTIKISRGDSKTQVSIEADYPKSSTKNK